jgi:Cytochrome c
MTLEAAMITIRKTAARAASRIRLNLHVGAGLVAAAATLFFAGDALAQDEAKVKAGLEAWKSVGCADCHGAFADGDKQRDESPTGANLRRARLNAEQLNQVIGCGRPGTEMPAFEDGAYTARACYGRPLGPPPDNMYPASANKLTAAQVDAVVAYLQVRIIGKGAITLAECLAYYDEAQKSWCDSFK